MSVQDISLADRFDLTKRHVLLNGTQALVRLMLMQALQKARSDELSCENGPRTFAFLLRPGKLRRL